MEAKSSNFARHWRLDPTVTFLNHGSFGACPGEVMDAQSALRARMEAEPVLFLARELEDLLDEARAALAGFVGADAADLAFVPNASSGVNTVLRALRFEAGDELLVSDQEYNASRNALEYVAGQWAAKTVLAPIPFPIRSEDEILEAVLSRVTPRTRIVLVDHVTSQTGLVFPLARLVREVQSRGVDVLVDGAHAPGMCALALDQLGAAYYTGNCHKWMCAPRGAAFLHVRRDRQDRIVPLVISHGWNDPRPGRSRFRRLFDWGGTLDPTPWLCVPVAIRVMAGLLPGGWEELRAANRNLALAARKTLCSALGVPEPAPESMIGSLAAVPLPDGDADAAGTPLAVDALQSQLFTRFHIEVPVIVWPRPPRRLLRVSAQIYNTHAQYEKLGAALGTLLHR